MKIEVSPREDHQVQIIAELDTETMLRFKQRAARKISSESKIPGFRPGKAPYEIVRRMYGDKAIEQEAVEIMLDEVYPEILKEAQVEPSGPGSLEQIISTDPPKFSFIVPLAPEVALGDYRSVRQDYNPPTVTEDEVDQIIQNLRYRYSVQEPVERPIQEGDAITANLVGTFTQPVEEENPQAFNQQGVQMVVGENEFEKDDWPYEGFTRELIGLNKNDEKTVVYTFPEGYDDTRLSGREVSIHTTIVDVHTLSTPDLTDDFAKTLGEYESVAALRDAIRGEMVNDRVREYDEDYFTRLIDEIGKGSTVTYSAQTLDHEVEHILENLEKSLAERQLDLPTYFKAMKTDRDAFIEAEAKPAARRRLNRSLIMDEIARVEKITLNMQELEATVSATMSSLQSNPQGLKLPRGTTINDLAQNVTMDVANRMLNRDTLLRLKAIGTGTADQLAEVEAVSEQHAESAAPVESQPVSEETPPAGPVEPPAQQPA